MRKFMWKKAAAAAMTATILATSATVLQAAAPPDGYTNAQDTVEAYGGAYSNWMTKWNQAGFALLAERYPDHVRFADLSGRGEQAMVDLQMFAEGGEGTSAPALSHAQAQQAIASGTMRADEGSGETPEVPAQTAPEKPEEPPAPQERPAPLPPVPGLQAGENAVRALHARWAAEEALYI